MYRLPAAAGKAETQIMKGIILAAGRGTRLYPITTSICKPLLPVYDKPLVYYPISLMETAGIRDTLIITPPGYKDAFVKLLGDGSRFGMHIEYRTQKVQKGIADALLVGQDFVGKDSVCLILGDNILFGPALRRKLRKAKSHAKEGAGIFGYYVIDPRPFGVVDFDDDGRAVAIEEKPRRPRSHYVVPGVYFYSNDVIDIARDVKPSPRGEMEITTVNNIYLEQNRLHVTKLGNEYTWFDAGNADSLFEAAGAVRAAQRSGRMVGCPEEIAFYNQWITREQLEKCADRMKKTNYGKYLDAIVDEF